MRVVYVSSCNTIIHMVYRQNLMHTPRIHTKPQTASIPTDPHPKLETTDLDYLKW